MGLLKTYTISADVTAGVIDAKKLDGEIKGAGVITNYTGMVYPAGSDQFKVYGEALSNEAGLDTLVQVHEAVTLAEYKTIKNDAIDTRTGELIALGYNYAGLQFSLSQNAQINILAIDTTRDELSYPIDHNNIDDTAVHQLVDATDVHNMYLTALATKKAHLDSGTAFKDQVRLAVDKAGVDAVIDNR